MDFPIHIPLVEDLGFELLHFGGGEAAIALDLKERHTNSFKVAHGGISMTLLDVAMAHAARSVNAEQPNHGPGVVTVEMKTSFMRPGEGRIVATGKLLHRTATLAFCEGRVESERGELIAHATATFKYLRAVPGTDRRVHGLQTPTPSPLSGPGSD
ncbi:PaaI family thioesterase [Rivibacter subsaxonicus]|uniref:Uncharacterized protein (TIGR00369 family) n=1 Tax=Rivibacter subsaxonicus TaxID=457575 RepID=A0A4Q7V9Q6_9BURK|nr:PaaI family thioesterase [Rivibacter subsaxonicus]RZT91422.1 uncharacterized protein (TIGR00369 family) [Rivibacter subsaxonicus]